MSLLILCFQSFAHKTPHAYKNDFIKAPSSYHTIISLGGGASFTSDAGTSQVFPIRNPIVEEQYDYQNNSRNQTAGLFNALVGVEWPILSSFAAQLGISYSYISNLTVKGNVTQGADAQSSDTYDYQYLISSNQLMIENKWLYNYRIFHPYFLLGAGAAFNTAKSYEVAIIPPFTTFSREYANNTDTRFTYAIGAGMDFNLSRFVRLGLGYRFVDLGKVNLGDAIIDTTPVNGSLSQSHLYTNEVLAQLIF